MGKEHDILVEDLEDCMEMVDRYRKSGRTDFTSERYMNFGMIVLALNLKIINDDEYHELCKKYFKFE